LLSNRSYADHGLASSIVIRVRWRRAVVEKMFCAQGRRDRLKLKRSSVEVEAVRKIVCASIGVAKWRQTDDLLKDLLKEVQDASEVVRNLRDVPRFGIGGDHD
jgi:hypothetical protein